MVKNKSLATSYDFTLILNYFELLWVSELHAGEDSSWCVV